LIIDFRITQGRKKVTYSNDRNSQNLHILFLDTPEELSIIYLVG